MRTAGAEALSKVIFSTDCAFTADAQECLQRSGACVEKPFDIGADALRRDGLPPA